MKQRKRGKKIWKITIYVSNGANNNYSWHLYGNLRCPTCSICMCYWVKTSLCSVLSPGFNYHGFSLFNTSVKSFYTCIKWSFTDEGDYDKWVCGGVQSQHYLRHPCFGVFGGLHVKAPFSVSRLICLVSWLNVMVETETATGWKSLLVPEKLQVIYF